MEKSHKYICLECEDIVSLDEDGSAYCYYCESKRESYQILTKEVMEDENN